LNRKGYFHRVAAQSPTKFWINNVTREEAQRAIDAGAVGCTQNPAYTWKMLNHTTECVHTRSVLDATLKLTDDDNEVLVRLQLALVHEVAEAFMPLWRQSGGQLGYVSIQGNPFKEDEEAIVEQARANRKDGPPNIMCKIPATTEGLKALATLAADGVPINATEVMAVRQALEVCETLRKATAKLVDPPPSYYSHITGIYDEYLQAWVQAKRIDISPDILSQAGLAIARKCYQMTKCGWPQVGFIGGGARELRHFTEMVGADACVTINWIGTADRLIEQNQPVVWRFYNPIADYVLDELLTKVSEFSRGYMVGAIETEEYENFGPVVLFRNSFEQAWENALRYVGERRAAAG
jgi:transaldolase